MPANTAPSRLARRVPSNERMSLATAVLAAPPAAPRGTSNAPEALFPSASARGPFASPDTAERSAQRPFAFHLRTAARAESKDASPSSEPRNLEAQDGWTAQDQSPAAEQLPMTNHGEPTSAPAPEASGEPAAGGDAAAPAPSEEPETELPNGGDLDSGATASESPETGGEASEPAPDEAKSAPPAWGKPEAGTSPRSSRRSPVATAVLAAVRSRIASHFPAVLPEQALSRHPFANLASLGDTSPGATPPGDTSPGEAVPGDVEPGEAAPSEVEPGEVEPGDVAPGDVEPGDVEPGDVEPGDVEPGDLAPGEAAPGDVEPGDVEPGDLAPGEAAPGDVEPGDVESGEAPPQGGTVATSEPPLPVPVIGETAPAEAVADLEPAAGLPNGGDLDGSATAPESPETGSQASEPAPDETKSAPPAWGKPEAGASPRSSRRSPVATAVLAAMRSRLASHFPAVLPEQALNRHPFANLASIGDTPPGDTSSGDVGPGAVEPGETIPQGGTAATSEPSLATPVIGETAPTEAAADLEPATGEGSAPQTDKTTPSAHPPEADTGQAKTSEVDTQAVPRIADQATPESAEQLRRTASVDDPKPSTVTSEVTTINYLKQNVLSITRKYSADGDTSADTAEVATVEASSDGLPGGMLLGDAGLIGGLLPTPSPDGSGPGVATGTPEGNSRNGASNQDFDNFSNVRVAAKLDAGIGEQAFRIHLRTTSALADGSREVSNLYDKVSVVPVRKFSTVHPQPVDKNIYSNSSPRLAESTEVGERVSPVAAVGGSREQAGARREGLGRSAAAVRAGKIPIAAESATVRARAASGTPVNRSPVSLLAARRRRLGPKPVPRPNSRRELCRRYRALVSPRSRRPRLRGI